MPTETYLARHFYIPKEDDDNDNDDDTDDGEQSEEGAKGGGEEQGEQGEGQDSEESDDSEEEEEEDEADEAGKKGGDPDYEDGMVQARHLQLRQTKFLPPQPRHRTNYLISVYSACRLQVAPLSRL